MNFFLPLNFIWYNTGRQIDVSIFEVKQYRKIKIPLGYQTPKHSLQTYYVYSTLKRHGNDRGVILGLPVLTLGLISFGKLTF